MGQRTWNQFLLWGRNVHGYRSSLYCRVTTCGTCNTIRIALFTGNINLYWPLRSVTNDSWSVSWMLNVQKRDSIHYTKNMKKECFVRLYTSLYFATWKRIQDTFYQNFPIEKYSSTGYLGIAPNLLTSIVHVILSFYYVHISYMQMSKCHLHKCQTSFGQAHSIVTHPSNIPDWSL